MAHNTRIRPDSAWIIGPVTPSGEWLTIDTNLTKAWNGDGGGTWQPTGHYTIGGSGMWFCGATNTFGGTSSAITTVLGGVGIVLDDNDHILLSAGHTGRSRDISVSFDTAVFASGWDLQQGPYNAIVSTALAANAHVRLRVHNGATLASVTFRFQVVNSHGPPESLPLFRVYATDTAGNVTPLLTNALSGYVPFTPTPATGAAWFAAGAVQSLTYTLDAGVVIDTSKYIYWAEVVDEDGTSAITGNQYIDVTASFTTILDMRPQ